MSESLVVYAGSGHYGKVKKRLIAKEARRLGYPSVSDFVWDMVRSSANGTFKTDLEEILKQENNGGAPASRRKETER